MTLSTQIPQGSTLYWYNSARPIKYTQETRQSRVTLPFNIICYLCVPIQCGIQTQLRPSAHSRLNILTWKVQLSLPSYLSSSSILYTSFAETVVVLLLYEHTGILSCFFILDSDGYNSLFITYKALCLHLLYVSLVVGDEGMIVIFVIHAYSFSSKNCPRFVVKVAVWVIMKNEIRDEISLYEVWVLVDIRMQEGQC